MLSMCSLLTAYAIYYTYAKLTGYFARRLLKFGRFRWILFANPARMLIFTTVGYDLQLLL